MLVKIIKRFKQVREILWFYSPRYLHLVDYFIAEKRYRMNLYFPWQKNKGLRFYEKKIVMIDPKKVKYYDTERFFSSFYFIQAGNWDLKKASLSDKLQYKIVQELFVEGKDIKELTCFNDLLLKAKSANSSMSMEDASELVLKKYQKLQNIYQKIKKNGYKTQKELNKSCINRFNTWYDEIRVSIDRNGEYILSGSGNHRLMIAKLLKLDLVPAILVRIHHDYYDHFLHSDDLFGHWDSSD